MKWFKTHITRFFTTDQNSILTPARFFHHWHSFRSACRGFQEAVSSSVSECPLWCLNFASSSKNTKLLHARSFSYPTQRECASGETADTAIIALFLEIAWSQFPCGCEGLMMKIQHTFSVKGLCFRGFQTQTASISSSLNLNLNSLTEFEIFQIF